MFTQRLAGNWECEVSGSYHCGPDHTTPKTFSYVVELSYPGSLSVLDSRGFLLDNLEAHTYFTMLCGPTDMSCEKLACYATNHFYTLAQRHSVLRCTVTICGIPDAAWITYTLPATLGRFTQ